jgi:membrane protease subunit HflC
MKNKTSFIIALIVVVMLGTYAVCFQVRYDQVAVKTTFDKADSNSIIDSPGLHFKAPWPFQKVETYSTRLQVLETVDIEQQTADEKTVIVQPYVTWSISDPLSFFKRIRTVEEANKRIESLLTTSRGVISKYTFGQLVNTEPSQLKLTEIEKMSTDQLQALVDSSGYGITVKQVGVRRIKLPEKTTESVFETMKKTRERMAANARQEGKAKAAAIKSDAETAAKRMKAIAERRAQEIRAKGDREAAKYYASFANDKEDFAIFLFKNEALKEMLKNNSTFVLPAEDLGLFESVGEVKLPAGQ